MRDVSGAISLLSKGLELGGVKFTMNTHISLMTIFTAARESTFRKMAEHQEKHGRRYGMGLRA